ncbi:MAG TPA: hypothetical protein VN457_04020 [Chlamydiales bacterium]|nr:hypothetical protein [Chlamydiales bacterium]
MSQLIVTLIITFSLIALGLLGMGIGYFCKRRCLKKQCDVNPDQCECLKKGTSKELNCQEKKDDSGIDS